STALSHSPGGKGQRLSGETRSARFDEIDAEIVPAWMEKLGIQAGQKFSDTVPRLKRAMKARSFSPAARVHMCLTLHTMPYRRENAVKPEAGKLVPLTPQDIANETGLKKQHIREYLL